MSDVEQSVSQQVIKAVGYVVVVYIIYMVLETMYKAYLGYGKAKIQVYPYTGSRSVKIEQNPNNPSAITLPVSENQLTGIEFSYSTFVYISDETDTNDDGWRTIFYKGYESSVFPLLGPGVFVSSKSSSSGAPVLRVVMNSYETWYNTLDVNQIPFNKWFHLVVVMRGSNMEVYVNGNLANKKSFSGTLPYQNYQPLNIFSTNKTISKDFNNNDSNQTTNKRGIPPGDTFTVNGKATGYVSNMFYFSYALSYSEIQSMMAMGPSKEFDQQNMDKPPYLIDSWWINQSKA
jgi:hypothetical protein